MTEGYDCYQNALAERINGIVKQELQKLIEQTVEIYNTKRPHLSLNYKTPNFIHNKNAELLKALH